MDWTEEQIFALAPDSSSFKSGKDLAKLDKWLSFCQSERAIWGECQGSGKVPYQTAIDISNIAFKCSCPSKKFPCKHSIGLFLLYIRQKNHFTNQEEPTFVAEWLNKRISKLQQKVENKPVDEKAQAKRIDARLKKVSAGIEELELWLRDLVRNGLIHAPNKPPNFWEHTAARMTDAQMGGVASMIRNIGELNFFSNKWQSQLLEILSRIYLLCEGYKRVEQLPDNLQIDLKSLMGWTQSQEELKQQEGVRDTWLILGKQEETEQNLIAQRNWLYGLQTHHHALILNFLHLSQPKDVSLLVGTAIEADIVFYPSNYPLRAIVKNRIGTKNMIAPIFFKNWSEVTQNQTDILAKNPWLDRLPILISGVRPMRLDEDWIIKDTNNQYVKVSPYKDTVMWQLLAGSGGKPLEMFVLKENDTYTPLGYWHNHKYHLLNLTKE
ncbi:MAG: SWIM zinc finger family protein [Thermoflexibacter sp.]|nr:SWIM zinc finger family protein [Thermoflexibacter sp.]